MIIYNWYGNAIYHIPSLFVDIVNPFDAEYYGLGYGYTTDMTPYVQTWSEHLLETPGWEIGPSGIDESIMAIKLTESNFASTGRYARYVLVLEASDYIDSSARTLPASLQELFFGHLADHGYAEYVRSEAIFAGYYKVITDTVAPGSVTDTTLTDLQTTIPDITIPTPIDPILPYITPPTLAAHGELDSNVPTIRLILGP